jgi:rare lipoprotein A
MEHLFQFTLEGEAGRRDFIPRIIDKGDCCTRASLVSYIFKKMLSRTIPKKLILMSFCSLFFLSSCVRARYFPGGGSVQTGTASWYGPNFHGKPTSNKEIYDMYEMTAAHRTLPFGTQVMVTNLDNGRTAVVRINDRGPFVKERIIDLSYAAARLLDIVGHGTAPVRLDVLEGQALQAEAGQKFVIQVGSFISESNARALESRLKNKYNNVFISLFETASQRYFRVRIQAKDQAAMRAIAESLSQDGYRVLILEE